MKGSLALKENPIWVTYPKNKSPHAVAYLKASAEAKQINKKQIEERERERDRERFQMN